MSKNNSKSRAVTDSTQSVLGAAGLNPLLLGVERDQVFGLGTNLTPASIQGNADVAEASLDLGVQSDDAAPLALDSTVIVADETAEMFALSASMPHDDPWFDEQWYLVNNVTGIDINVLPVWADYDGTGVTIGIWDDGVQSNHPDLADNYDASLHIILENGDVHDPEPEDLRSAHGTAVAGIIAGVDNAIGVIGVAHGASIAGVDMFFDEALGVSIYTSAIKNFDVTNHSWGWTGGYFDSIFNPDDFAFGEPFWADFHTGFHDGVIEGRGGLGTITVT